MDLLYSSPLKHPSAGSPLEDWFGFNFDLAPLNSGDIGTQPSHHIMGDYSTMAASNCLLQSADKQKTVMEGGSTGLSPNGSNNNEAPIKHNMSEPTANNQQQSLDRPFNNTISQHTTVSSQQANIPAVMANGQPGFDAMNPQFLHNLIISLCQQQSLDRPLNNANSQYNTVSSHQTNTVALMANGQPMPYAVNQYSQSLSKPLDQPQSLDPPLNNAISHQQHTVVGSLPTDSTVEASQHRDLENTDATPNIPNLLGSVGKQVKQTGSVPQSDREKGENVQLRLNDNQFPSGDMYQLEVMVHPFVVEVPRKMPLDSWKRDINKKFEAQLETLNITLTDCTWKATIGKKRTTQTVSSDSDREYTLKRKTVHIGATDSDLHYDYKKNIFEETRATIKNSANALSDEIPIARNKTARGLPQKSTCAALSPRVEAQNLDSAHQISEACKRQKLKFSVDEIKQLIDGVFKYGVGGWQRIEQEFFKGSSLKSNDLKGRWRSLVETAKREPKKRRSRVPEELLAKVKEFYEARVKRGANPTQLSPPQDETLSLSPSK